MSPVYHAELEKIPRSADKGGRTFAFKPTRASTMTYCECHSGMHFSPKMRGSITLKQKWGESEGSKPRQTERFVLFCIQEMVRGNFRSARRRGQSREKRPRRKKSKNVPRHSTPFGKKYSKKLLTVECCYWNFPTPRCSTLHLWFWEILAKHCSIENHHFYVLCAIIVSEAELRHQPSTPTIKFWCSTCFRSWMEMEEMFWGFFGGFFVMAETLLWKHWILVKPHICSFPCKITTTTKCVLYWNRN